MENQELQEQKENGEREDGNTKKKRMAEKQMRKEEDQEDDIQEEDSGTFQRADEVTIAQRRKVKVRRSGTTAAIEKESSENAPLFYPTFNFTPKSNEINSNKGEKKEENKTKLVGSLSSDTVTSTTTPQIFFQTSFTFSVPSTTPAFSIPIPNFGTSFSSSGTASIFGENIAKPSTIPTTSVETPTSTTPVEEKSKLDLPTSPIATGEEGEHHEFQSRVKLFVLELGTKDWKERGVGLLKVNIADDKSYARLIMRIEGSLRLVLNTRLWKTLKIEKVGDKAARFTAPNLDKTNELCTYLIRVSRPEIITDFINAVDTNKHLGGNEHQNNVNNGDATPTPKESKNVESSQVTEVEKNQ